MSGLRAALTALAVLASVAPSCAEDFTAPHVTLVRADWGRAVAELARLPLKSAADPDTARALDELNETVGRHFTDIAASPVPVLLPLDVEDFLRARAEGSTLDASHYLSGFRATRFFTAGPGGYDAVFEVRSGATSELSNLNSREPVFVNITGAARLFDLPDSNGVENLPDHGLDRDFPGLRRFIIENHMRFSFERYGVTYVVSILCFDGPARGRRVSCRDADRVGKVFLRELQFAGGKPQPERAVPPPHERPQKLSDDFRYYGPGQILPRTGVKGRGGVVDRSVYGTIRFPLADVPAFVNSQSFMHWGNCDMTGRVGWRSTKGAPYRCSVNRKPLTFDESAQENYSYPWRDNFCEHRAFYVGQCPSGFGHQGVDIRPSECKLRKPDSDRCQPYSDDVVAVRDGMILRPGAQDGIVLVSNTDDGLLRFRYIHMNPRKLDADTMTNGRLMREGEVLGQVGNYSRYEGATTVHLHFEMMVPTHDGFVRVNPYATLIAAYERLIGARGQQVDDPEAEAAVAASGNGAETEKAVTSRKVRKRGKKKRRR